MEQEVILNPGMEEAANTTAPEATPEKPKKKKKKKGKTKWIVLGVLVLIVVAVLVMCNALTKAVTANLLAYSDTTVLEYASLEQSISATGKVVSKNSRNVYSTQSYPVLEIPVKLGDTVKEGDVLCTLDPSTLKEQIEKKELSMEMSAKSASQQVRSARDNYNASKDALDNGLNASLISAQNQVDTAYDNWIKAQETYEQFKDNKKKGLNPSLIQAQQALNNAEQALNNARKALNAGSGAPGLSAEEAIQILDAAEEKLLQAETTLLEAEAAFQAGTGTAEDYAKAQSARDTAKAERDSAKSYYSSTIAGTSNSANPTLQQNFDAAQTAYDSALASYRAAKNSAETSEEDYEKAIETAHKNYETAQKSLQAAEASAQSQLQSSYNSLRSSQIGADDALAVLELAQMQQDLEDTVITAPISGTVTAIYATLGSSGSGLLFVIEDTENLMVETTVKEYDMGTVAPGMPVRIKADATGDEAFEGKIVSIAPTSKKNASGATDTTGDVLFETDVSVLSRNTGLRIGMNVRLNYLVEQKEDILFVPYEAIYQNAAGENCVLMLTPQEDGTYLIGELPVSLGMENDLNTEIYGEGVNAGMRIINAPGIYRAMIGQSIPLSEQSILSGDFSGGTGMMMVGPAGQ